MHRLLGELGIVYLLINRAGFQKLIVGTLARQNAVVQHQNFIRIPHGRRVSAARTLLDNGKNASDLQRLCGIPDYPARKTMEAARRFTPEFCRRAAELVLETDYKIKTSYDEPERLLELLLLQLAQEGRNG